MNEQPIEAFDVLIIGAGVAGVSCALVLGSSLEKAFATDKKVGLIAHQKASYLQNAVLNNVYGVTPKTNGSELLKSSLEHLTNAYSKVQQMLLEKVTSVSPEGDLFVVTTNKNSYKTKTLVVAANSSDAFTIEGLTQYVEPHGKSPAATSIKLKNSDHKVAENIYVAGTLAGHRSQVAIASGSGAMVASEIIVQWNGNTETHIHDSLPKQ